MATPHKHGGQGSFHPGGCVSLMNKPSSPTSSDDGRTLDDGSSPITSPLAEKQLRVASPATAHCSPQSSHAMLDNDMNSIMDAPFFKPGVRFHGDDDYVSRNTRPGAPRFMPPHAMSRQNMAPYNPGRARRPSRAWLSPEEQRKQDYQLVRNSMRRLFKKADVAHMTMDDYNKHVEAVLESKKARHAKLLEQKEADRVAKEANERAGYIIDENLCAVNVAAQLPCNSNITMKGNVGRVLGEPTIWCCDWTNGKNEIADWPSIAELKWEGDDRAKTGVGRYPPLPRERGAIGILWGQLQVVEQYPMDQIAQIPTMEDVYLPVDEIDDHVKYSLINKSLEEAMDEYLES